MPPPKQSRVTSQEVAEKPPWVLGDEGTTDAQSEINGSASGDVASCLGGAVDSLHKPGMEAGQEDSSLIQQQQQQQQQKSLASIIERLQRENALREHQNKLNGGCGYMMVIGGAQG